MRFLRPEFFPLFWLLPLVILAWIFSVFHKLQGRQQFGDTTRLRVISKISPLWRDIARFFLLSLVWVVLILTLAHPQYEIKRHIPEWRNIDLVFLLDTSPSMRAQDVKPSRLLRAKELIAGLVAEKTPADRIGLTMFSETHLILSYLTSDPGSILFYLDWIGAETEPILGTNLGGGIQGGMRVFQKDDEIRASLPRLPLHDLKLPQGVSREMGPRRIFVLISDGEDHGEALDEAIEEAKRRGIPIYAMGIGSDQEVPIPLGGEPGKANYLVVEGKTVTTQFRDATMRRVAEQTGGRFYRSSTGQGLSSVLSDIWLAEREVRGYQWVLEYQEAYPQFLSLALGIFLTAMVI